MKKINIVQKNDDFSRIINLGSTLRYKDYAFYLEKTIDQPYQFGISVGKKLGNAVFRNKIRRQIKDIIDENKYMDNFNCIIMVKKSIIEKDYLTIKLDLNDAFNRIGIIKNENKE